jgi:hypothetical protein
MGGRPGRPRQVWPVGSSMSDFWGRADQGQMRPHGRPRSKADVQSTMPGRRYRDLYEGSTMLSRSTGPLGSSARPRRGQRKDRSGDENPPRAVDRQSTPLVPVCTCASDSPIIHPRTLQAVAADFTSSSEHTAFPLAPAPWS